MGKLVQKMGILVPKMGILVPKMGKFKKFCSVYAGFV
jgi:hypothetical protein